MGRVREKWDKKLREVRQMRLSGLDVKTAPDSTVAGLKAPGKSRQSQKGRCQLKSALQQV